MSKFNDGEAGKIAANAFHFSDQSLKEIVSGSIYSVLLISTHMYCFFLFLNVELIGF